MPGSGFRITLNAQLQKWVVLNDGNRDSGHLRLGFTLMPRSEFIALMAKAGSAPGRPSRWPVDKFAKGIQGQARSNVGDGHRL
jgi:hypothetical protein